MAAREPDLESDFGDGKYGFLRTETTHSKASEGTAEPQINTLYRHSGTSLGAAVPAPNPAARVIGDFRTLSLQVTDTQARHPTFQATKKGVAKDISDLDWHTLSAEDVCTRLGVSRQSGLDSPVVVRRQQRDGKNVIPPPPKHLLRKIFVNIFGGFGGLLLVASIICFIAWRPLGDPNPAVANLVLAVVLLIVIVIQAVFNTWQDYTTGRVMASITNMLPSEVIVVRDHESVKVTAPDLVVGDLVKITLGSKVPADLRLIEVSSDLRFDRSILTGESKPIAATVDATDPNFMESHNIGLQGTLCTSGSGFGICVGLGANTVFGRIAKQATQERPGRTTLEAEILRFVLIIAGLALSIVILIVILWAAWLRRDHPDFIPVPVLLIDCVSVAVAFIPEGLPVCVTLSLTVVAKAMRKAGVLCKSLSTVESLGAVNVILSDKTGTLTQNRMSVVNLALGCGESQFTVHEARESATRGARLVQSIAAAATLCNDAEFAPTNDEKDYGVSPEVREVHGDATDSGLLRFAESISPVESTRDEWDEVGQLAFNSANKFAVKLFKVKNDKFLEMAGILGTNLTSDDYLLLIKGAPDILSARCAYYFGPEGVIHPLDDGARSTLRSAQESFASRGERVLLFASKVLPTRSIDLNDPGRLEDALKKSAMGLCVLGLVALVDPPREDARRTVEICRRAGIRFAMVTGDFASTASAIAKNIGIITSNNVKSLSDLDASKNVSDVSSFDADKDESLGKTALVISGSEMITMTETQWKQILTFDELVFARTSPQQKLQIVRAFQGDGCCVAVTGDGVNDAPALKQADVGVAIAGGSEVATEAADLILLSDFSAIVTAIEYGRLCFENLRKSILYLLPAGSFSELMPIVLNTIFGVPQALSSIQMIIICVFTDVGPALSMVYEKPEADLLTRKPRDRKKERLVDIRLLLHAYGFIGILESLTAMVGAFYFGYQRNGIPFSALWLKFGAYDVDPDYLAEITNRAQSIYFFNLVLIQWFNLLASRTRRRSIFQQNPLWGKYRNLWVFPAMAVALALGCLFAYIPWFQQVLLTRGVRAEYFFLPLAYGIVLLFLEETRKYLNRKYPTSLLAKLAW